MHKEKVLDSKCISGFYPVKTQKEDLYMTKQLTMTLLAALMIFVSVTFF